MKTIVFSGLRGVKGKILTPDRGFGMGLAYRGTKESGFGRQGKGPAVRPTPFAKRRFSFGGQRGRRERHPTIGTKE